MEIQTLSTERLITKRKDIRDFKAGIRDRCFLGKCEWTGRDIIDWEEYYWLLNQSNNQLNHLGKTLDIPLEEGGFVADTPGLRQLGLWDVAPEEIEWCFREFQPLLGTCKFANCVHIGEVGCAIEAAVESGAVDGRRWASYHRLLAGGYE